MSSTTPGNGPREEAPSGEPVNGGPEAGRRPAGAGADTTAMRTSLAHRFAAAKASGTDDGATAAPTARMAPSADQAATSDGGRPDRAPDETAVRRPAGAPPRGGRPTGAGAKPGTPAKAAAGAAGAEAAAKAGAPDGPGRGSMPFDERDRGRPAAPRPEGPRPEGPRPGPRQVRLSLARIDPWSVMKLAFLLSIAVGIGIVVATAAMWFVLDTMHVFADVQALLDDLGSESFINLMEYTQFDRVISMAAIVAVLDVLLLTALATLGAFLYNIVAALVGGLHVTLTDD